MIIICILNNDSIHNSIVLKLIYQSVTIDNVNSSYQSATIGNVNPSYQPVTIGNVTLHTSQ